MHSFHLITFAAGLLAGFALAWSEFGAVTERAISWAGPVWSLPLERTNDPPAIEIPDIIRRIDSATAPHFPDLLEAISAEADPTKDALLLELLWTRWAEIDPTAAAAAALAHPEDSRQALRLVFAQWGSRNRNEALAAARSITDERRRYIAVDEVLTSWRETDPEAFLGIMHTLPEDHQKHQRRDAILTLAERDPIKAARIAAAFSEDERARIYPWIAGVWARSDPATAMKWAEELAMPSARAQAMKAVLLQWVRTDPETAGDQLAKVPGFSAEIAGALAQHDPAAAVRLLDKQLPARQMVESTLQLIRDMRNDADVLAMFDAMENSPQRDQLVIKAIEQEWYDRDFAKAAAWIETALAANDLQNNPLPALIRAWAMRDGKGAHDYLETLPEATADAHRLSLFEGLAGYDPVQTIEDSKILEDADRSNVLGQVVEHLQDTDPRRATAAFQEITDTEVRQHQGYRLGVAYAEQSSPEEALRWAEELDAPTKARVQTGIVRSWVRQDPYAASEWLARQPLGAGRDAAAELLISTVVEDDPESAFDWALTIESEEARIRHASEAVKYWIQREPATVAREAIERSELSPDERALLFKELKNDGPER